jgi:hypothetical protein
MRDFPPWRNNEGRGHCRIKLTNSPQAKAKDESHHGLAANNMKGMNQIIDISFL